MGWVGCLEDEAGCGVAVEWERGRGGGIGLLIGEGKQRVSVGEGWQMLSAEGYRERGERKRCFFFSWSELFVGDTEQLNDVRGDKRRNNSR